VLTQHMTIREPAGTQRDGADTRNVNLPHFGALFNLTVDETCLRPAAVVGVSPSPTRLATCLCGHRQQHARMRMTETRKTVLAAELHGAGHAAAAGHDMTGALRGNYNNFPATSDRRDTRDRGGETVVYSCAQYSGSAHSSGPACRSIVSRQ